MKRIPVQDPPPCSPRWFNSTVDSKVSTYEIIFPPTVKNPAWKFDICNMNSGSLEENADIEAISDSEVKK